MKQVSPAMLAHLAGTVTTLCSCVLITRLDGMVLGFTDLDQPITVDGQIYATALGYQRTAITGDDGLSVDNTEFLGVFDSDSITEDDLLSGLFDYARLEIFAVNWTDLTMGRIAMRHGILGEVSARPSGTFSAEMRGMMQLLTNQIGQLYTASCRASLGDARCKIPIATPAWQHNGVVTSISPDGSFAATGLTETDTRTLAPGWFVGGVVTWTSGANNGRSMEIKNWYQVEQVIAPFMPMPRPVLVGDTFSVVPGCDHLIATCKTKFNNVANFRGEPYIPGPDAIMRTVVK